ncbi:MAG TPA: SPOR domain-containing protein [Hellea balneolensis]|uniref:SPOR domain-containing protein n=1 Tax=Hellea balneolensis TaxID=287478 RepID=A0A7C5LRE9_9PROT|nr:SPOR domain-containing protein [Hellea balneolensis]
MENEPQDAYMPPPDREALEPFDVREQTSKKGMFIIFGVILALIITAILMLKMFAAGTRSRNDTPRILADNRPYKEVPIDRGGVQTPNQDKEIYDNITGKPKTEDVKILSTVEEPVKPPKPQNNSGSKPAANIVIKAPETVEPKPNPKPKPESQPKTATSRYVVQVASLRSRAEADALWGRLRAKMGGVIGSKHFADIKKVNLKSKGIYYRLRISGFANKSEAASMCKKLEARKQDCFVTTK